MVKNKQMTSQRRDKILLRPHAGLAPTFCKLQLSGPQGLVIGRSTWLHTVGSSAFSVQKPEGRPHDG